MHRLHLLLLLATFLLFATGCAIEGDEAGECTDGVDND